MKIPEMGRERIDSNKARVSVFLALLQLALPARPDVLSKYTSRNRKDHEMGSLVCLACPQKRVYNAIGESVFPLI
jgi:hypothetical protein